MSLTIAYVALATGVVVWLVLVRLLSTKSWEPQPATSVEASDNRFPAARVGLWIFLGVITSLFALFVSAYYMRMGGHGDVVVQDWNPLPEPGVLWLNTVILILASVAMQMARTSVAGGHRERAWTGLLIGGLLTFAFLAGQYYAWRILRQADFFSPANPAIAFFYLLTAVHGLHLLGGLFVWSRTLNRMRNKEVELIDVRLSVELCSVYWHYLLLVWLGVFAVLLST